MVAITGACGKTGSKVAELLLAKNIPVRAIGKSYNQLKQLGEKGAEIMAGDQSDMFFLIKAFTDIDSVFFLVPSKPEADDHVQYYNSIADSAVSAIKTTKIKKMIFLSSIDGGSLNGPIRGLYDVERKLCSLKKVDIIILKAGFILENLLNYDGITRARNFLGNTSNLGEPIKMISALEIGEKVVDLLQNPIFKGHSVRNLFGQKWSFIPRQASV